MTDVSDIVSKLDTDKVLIAQVLQAKSGGFDLPALSAQEIHSLLTSEFDGQVYPVYLPEDASHPSLVYTLTGVDTLETDGYRLTQTDSYRLTIRTKTTSTVTDYADFEAKMRAVIAALRTSAYSVEPVDMELSYDDEMQVVRADIDIELTYIAQPDGGTPGNDSAELPVAFVYPVGRDAEESEYSNLVKQRVTDRYAIVLITVDSNITQLIAEVNNSLLGYAQSAEYFDMEYLSGQNLGGVSNMEVWREIYHDSHMIQET